MPIHVLSEPTEEEIISLVTSTFDFAKLIEDSDVLQFKIESKNFKVEFVGLAQKLEAQSVACKIQSKDDGLYLVIKRIESRKQSRLYSSWIPRILFIVVVIFVMVDGHYRTLGSNDIIWIGEPLEMAVVYTVALLGILGIHELGHLIASRIHKIKTTLPYFIPGLPIIGIPTFGALIMAKGLMINREKTFDVAIAGPIAGLVITVIVAVYAASTAPTIDQLLSEQLYEDMRLIEWRFGEPLLMTASLGLFEKGGENEVLMTPLLFAAWIGFFLTFANLMPAGQLDGGHLMRTAFGKKTLRIFTYVSAAILFLMNFWFVALFVLLMSGRNARVSIMDDVTPITRKRKISYGIVMVLAVLCAPIPENLTVVEPLLHLIQQLPSV